MTKSKTFLVGVYIFIISLVVIFVFGESGILDNMTHSQEIVKLEKLTRESLKEIEEMTKEYEELVSMKKPSAAFLISQGRKMGDIVVFQHADLSKSNKKTSSIEEQQLFFMISLIALVILLAGCIGISVIHYVNMKHKKEHSIEQESKDDVIL